MKCAQSVSTQAVTGQAGAKDCLHGVQTYGLVQGRERMGKMATSWWKGSPFLSGTADALWDPRPGKEEVLKLRGPLRSPGVWGLVPWSVPWPLHGGGIRGPFSGVFELGPCLGIEVSEQTVTGPPARPFPLWAPSHLRAVLSLQELGELGKALGRGKAGRCGMPRLLSTHRALPLFLLAWCLRLRATWAFYPPAHLASPFTAPSTHR